MTLRFRLAAWNALVIILTALVTLLGLREGVRWAILHEMDQILQEDTEEVALALSELPANDFPLLIDELERKAIGHKHHGWFAQLLAANGNLVWSSVATPQLFSSPRDAHHTPSTIDNYRLVDRPVDARNSEVALIRIGAQLDFLQADMGRIDRLVLLAVGGVLVIGPLVSYWLAGRATKTIGNIIETAERLRPNYLEERLPILGTGDQLDRLAVSFNGLLDRIATSLEQNRDYLANAAHELRTPLTAIRSAVEVALSSPRSNEEYQDLLVDVIDQSIALQTLVNQLLLISESEAERFKTDHDLVALDEIVRQVSDMFAGIAESRNIQLETRIRGPVMIRGSRHLLRQVVSNLLDNALKYTPAQGRVTVELTHDQSSHRAILEVSDTGIGIGASDLPKIFDRFFRGDRSRLRSHAGSGTGLGLSICQAAVAAHRGEISCQSEPHRGTRLVVTLPTVESN